MLTIINSLPGGFLDATTGTLHEIIPTPTLIHLAGERDDRLFVTVLQHGNECVGLNTIQALLKGYIGKPLPRGLSIFVANVQAAKENARHLDDQVDFNRAWPGTLLPSGPETLLMSSVVDEMRKHDVFASVDLHNNMGLNPHYACINRIDDRFLRLANLFSRTVVYFTEPKGVQSMAMADLCPATTLECGKPDDERGVSHATDYLNTLLHLENLENHPVAARDIDLFHTVAIVKVPEEISLGVGDERADLMLVDDLEHMNFRELRVGTVLGAITAGKSRYLTIQHDEGHDVTDDFIEIDDDRIRLKKPVMPSMLTINTTAIRQDCLCYFMERYNDRVR